MTTHFDYPAAEIVARAVASGLILREERLRHTEVASGLHTAAQYLGRVIHREAVAFDGEGLADRGITLSLIEARALYAALTQIAIIASDAARDQVEFGPGD